MVREAVRLAAAVVVVVVEEKVEEEEEQDMMMIMMTVVVVAAALVTTQPKLTQRLATHLLPAAVVVHVGSQHRSHRFFVIHGGKS